MDTYFCRVHLNKRPYNVFLGPLWRLHQFQIRQVVFSKLFYQIPNIIPKLEFAACQRQMWKAYFIELYPNVLSCTPFCWNRCVLYPDLNFFDFFKFHNQSSFWREFIVEIVALFCHELCPLLRKSIHCVYVTISIVMLTNGYCWLL